MSCYVLFLKPNPQTCTKFFQKIISCPWKIDIYWHLNKYFGDRESYMVGLVFILGENKMNNEAKLPI